MKPLDAHHEAVGRFYDRYDEANRLETEDPIEYAITLRYLQRYIPGPVTVADVGVGGGQDSEHLARCGCRLHLVDVSEHLLHAAVARLEAAGLGGQIESQRRTSATDVSHLPTASCDAVLLLGPLYHLLTASERRLAYLQASPLAREVLLNLVERTGTTPQGLGVVSHSLSSGRVAKQT